MRSGQGLRGFAATSALVLVNTLGLLVALNLLIALYLDVTAPPPPPDKPSARERGEAVLARQGMDVFRRVYPGKSDAEIRALVRGQAVLDTSYEPFAEFRSPALTEEGVTIHEAGFRMIGPEQGPWPLDPRALNVFVFGGSTAFGGGVNDEEAIPAQLQTVLRDATGQASINVYNFGVGASFSSQEVTYFQNQLRYGNVPDLVVFLDGLNDFAFPDGLTAASEYYRDSMRAIRSLQSQLGRDRGFLWHVGELVRSLPMARLAERLAHPPAAPTAVGEATADPFSDPLLADRGRLAAIIDRYLVNRDVAAGVAERFGIQAVFVWQPIPLYKYDTSFHPFEIPVGHRLSGFGYPLMAELIAERPLGPDFVWCADLQEALREPLYVDPVHYTPAMSHRVAECIARGVLDSGAFERAWSRLQAGRPERIAARERLAARRERAVARLFGPSAQTPDLAVEGPLDGQAGASRLVDASPHFASVFQDIALEPDARPAAYRVAFRVRAGSSPAAQLVLQFTGARSETYEVSFDPRAMQLRGGRGLASLEPDADGWYHLSLLAASPGAESLRVQLIPRQGDAEDRGDIVFGGGTLWAVEEPAHVAAPGPRER
jgi:hypothetical protein